MRKARNQKAIERQLRGVFRSMDFISKHPALEAAGAEARKMAAVYQQLGIAWHFLALQCQHRNGWRKGSEGAAYCRSCGTRRGEEEESLLLASKDDKVIGRRVLPTTHKVLANRKAATVLNETISFHGARLNVEVLNPHHSRFFRDRNITVASDRIVKMTEAEVECRIDGHLVAVGLKKRRKGSRPLSGAFVGELPKKLLNRCPMIIEFDEKGRFAAITIFRQRPDSRSRK